MRATDSDSDRLPAPSVATISGDSVICSLYSGAGAAMPRAVAWALMREGFASTLWDTSSSLPSARAVSMLVCSERVSSAQEAAAEVMATRAMAMSAMTMQMTAQAFARERAAAEMPSLWARRPAPGTTEMEGASSKESSSARDEET